MCPSYTGISSTSETSSFSRALKRRAENFWDWNIGLALDFQTWKMMVRQQGLTDEQALELIVRMVQCAPRE